MSRNPITKRAFGKSGFFWFALLVAVYLLMVAIEEATYKKFQGEWITYTTKNSPLLDNNIRALTTDDKGQLWIGTKKGLYLIAPDGSWTIYTKENTALLSDEIWDLTVDRLGRIWVGTSDGLYIVDPNGNLTLYLGRRQENFPLSIKALVVDHLDRVWVGTFAGLSVFDEKGVETIYTEHNSGLVHNYVTALAVDRFDRIWIGTFGYGVSVLDQDGHWITYQENRQQQVENELLDNNIYTFLIDQQDRVWIGTECCGISILDPDGNWTSYAGNTFSNSDPNSDNIRAFALDKQERVWIGTMRELALVDTKENWSTYTFNNSGLQDSVWALAIDDTERLWVGTSSGLSVLNLREGPPRTVPDRWLGLRAIILAPLWIITSVGEWLLAPSIDFMYHSLYFCSITYVGLLILILPAMIGIRHGAIQKKPKLFRASLGILILSIIGVIVLWFFSYIIGMIPT